VIKDKRAFGRPDDPFTYRIELKRAPWLKTRLQLELLDGCDCGNWVPKDPRRLGLSCRGRGR